MRLRERFLYPCRLLLLSTLLTMACARGEVPGSLAGAEGETEGQAVVANPAAARVAYETYCAGCHGADGDGAGEAARFLHPKPRDLRAASFKFSSTRVGELPTDDDLRRSIREGLAGTAMAPWNHLSDATIELLVDYIKTLSPRWQQDAIAADVFTVPDPYAAAADKTGAVRRGELIYHGYATCWSCHPAYLPEDQINAHLASFGNEPYTVFRDGIHEALPKENADGEIVYTPDFLRDPMRAGIDVDDLYRSIAAGISGTAMPTWIDSINSDPSLNRGGLRAGPDDLWAMAYYVERLIGRRPSLLKVGEFTVRERPIFIDPTDRPGLPAQTAEPFSNDDDGIEGR